MLFEFFECIESIRFDFETAVDEENAYLCFDGLD